MGKTIRYAEVKYNVGAIPAEWSDFISNYGFRWSKRSTTDFVQWKELRGKGFQIWISMPRPNQGSNGTFWKYAIESTKHIPALGIEFLESLLIDLKSTFPETEINKTVANKT